MSTENSSSEKLLFEKRFGQLFNYQQENCAATGELVYLNPNTQLVYLGWKAARQDAEALKLHYAAPDGWKIEWNPKPIPDRTHDYDFVHKDYDGADGGNGLCGTAISYSDALNQIIQIEIKLAQSQDNLSVYALKNITDRQVNNVLRAFWRRIEPYKSKYGKELPNPLPVEFAAHMATALSYIDYETTEDNQVLRDSIIDALAESLGDAYDCGRTWSAWGTGTMSQHDFYLVCDSVDRMSELADSVMGVIFAKKDEVNEKSN